MHREATTLKVDSPAIVRDGIEINEAVERVLRLPTVAEKTFLITIGDRSVTGLVARDQMVGLAGACSELCSYGGKLRHIPR